MDPVLGARECLVLPQQRCASIICLTHDMSCHMGIHTVRDLINTRFTWPGLGKHVDEMSNLVMFA